MRTGKFLLDVLILFSLLKTQVPRSEKLLTSFFTLPRGASDFSLLDDKPEV
jgi:hypothetical protein